jgi:hypothetical protein
MNIIEIITLHLDAITLGSVKFKDNFKVNLILFPVLTFVGIVSLLLKANKLVGLFLKVNFI